MILGFVFPGQGAQQVGMGHDLPRDTFHEADEALGFALSKIIFEGPEEELRLTANSQPAILTVSIAMLRQQQRTPELVAGHSLGEYSALVCAGALSFADAVRLVHKRGRYMQDAVPAGEGAMAALMGLDEQTVIALCEEGGAEPANFNGAGQIVIAGKASAVERTIALAKARGGKAIPLKVSAPFHCSLMAPAAARLKADLASLRFDPARMPVVCNVDAQPHRDGFATLLEQQVTAPVRWEATLRRMADMGVSEVMEIGPGKTLSALIKRSEPRLRLA